MKILEATGLNKHFGGLAATSNVDIDVEQGEILGLIGPNGAGKTTLFNLLSGAVPPDSGAILFGGGNIAGLKPHRIARMGIARTFQSVKIFSGLSVLDNIRLGHLFGKPALRRLRPGLNDPVAILDFVGLGGMGDRRAVDLILAHQKRLEVGRALASNPDILLLDEVMAGLTPTEVAQAMDLVRAIRTKGITVVMIEHVMKAIMAICDRIAVLHHGVKIAEGTPGEITTNATVIDVYLGE